MPSRKSGRSKTSLKKNIHHSKDIGVFLCEVKLLFLLPEEEKFLNEDKEIISEGAFGDV